MVMMNKLIMRKNKFLEMMMIMMTMKNVKVKGAYSNVSQYEYIPAHLHSV